MLRRLLFRVLAVTLGLLASLLLVAIVDRVLIVHWAPGYSFQRLYPPSSQSEMRTSEFQATIRSNKLGLRDREISLAKGNARRVLALGDSFTWGFGVELEDCWVKVLEASLRKSGYDVEVINGGKAGVGTKEYALIAEEVVPVLKPDLVLVAVLQGDDLAQAVPEKPRPEPSARTADQGSFVRRCARSLAEIICPNLLRIRRAGKPAAWRAYKELAAERIARMNEKELAWLQGLDPLVQQMFRSGDLNPALVTLAMAKPDHFTMTMHPERADVQARIEEMSRHLERIRTVCEDNGARVVVCSVPYGAYVAAADLQTRRRIGFEVEDGFLSSDGADEPIRLASQRAGLPFHSVLAEFRREAVKQRLYFEWDGHFNPAGHRAFADLIETKIVPILDAGE